ncbi:hypothetical protein [Polyangium mundeleinium]|uniref:Uncharacterized protein n=1 Tax=Polyangium mundeleinium TaxID=2995306 RepID=A0ABT5F7H1_9BACT|nr:hypothetical protein [Polyangium mundeleinium]MDC0749067.1 hypothetical protein [Polyangium mundeleinium]
MSRGKLGEFADDPDSVFVDVPPNPAWIAWVDALIAGGAAVGTFFAAKHFGANGVLAAVLAALAAPLAGFKLSFFARHRRIPRLTVEEFDAARRAGSLALAEFRRANPEHTQVDWSLVASSSEGNVIGCMGSREGADRMARRGLIVVYLVAADGAIREVADPRLGSYSQRIGRSECVNARG